MKKLLVIILSFTFVLVACTNEDIDKEHLAYIENLGWTIKSFHSSEQIIIDDIPPEMFESDRAVNMSFMEKYVGKKLTVTSYQLSEKDLEGKNYFSYVYEYEGKIIGAGGVLRAFPGGMFNLADKEEIEKSNKEIQKKAKELYGEYGNWLINTDNMQKISHKNALTIHLMKKDC